MPVVMLLAVAAVLVCVFFVATGWGGELSYERPDHAPLDLGPISATDIALMRPPTALWGYNMQVTDEALEVIARAVRDRDVTIATLQQQLAEFGRRETPALQPPEPRSALEATQPAESVPSTEVRLPPYLRQPSDTRQRPEPSQRPEPDHGPDAAPTRPDMLPAHPKAPPTGESFSFPEVGPASAIPPTAESSPAPAARDQAGDSPAPDPSEPLSFTDAVPDADSPPPAEAVPAAGSLPSAEAVPPAGSLPSAEAVPAAGSPPPADVVPAADSPPAEVRPTATDPSTRFLLKASPPSNTPHVPEHTATSPAADISQNPQAVPPLSAPTAVETTQPSTVSTRPDDVPGPQGSYDAHGWWAEQQRAARAEQAADDPSSDVDPPMAGDGPELVGDSDDETMAAAEEQGW